MIILVVMIAVVVAVLLVGKDTTSRNGGRPEQDRVRIQAELFLWQLLLLLLLLLWYCHIGCIHSVVWVDGSSSIARSSEGAEQILLDEKGVCGELLHASRYK